MNRNTLFLVLFMFIVVVFLLLSPHFNNGTSTETSPNVVEQQDPVPTESETTDMRESATDAPEADDVPMNADVASEPLDTPPAANDKTMELPPAEGQ